MQIISLPLPIDFISFRARREAGYVDLAWSIDNAEGGNTFEIMRSTDGGLTFSPIARASLENGRRDYTFADTWVSPYSQYIYRIDFVEYTGTRISSPLRSVTTAPGESTVEVMNPVRDQLALNIMAPLASIEVTWYDITGKSLLTNRVDSPSARTRLAVPDVPPGQYLVHLQWPGGAMQSLVQKW
jgi:hypothetical protein